MIQEQQEELEDLNEQLNTPTKQMTQRAADDDVEMYKEEIERLKECLNNLSLENQNFKKGDEKIYQQAMSGNKENKSDDQNIPIEKELRQKTQVVSAL